VSLRTLGYIIAFSSITFLVGDKKRLKIVKGVNPRVIGVALLLTGAAIMFFSPI